MPTSYKDTEQAELVPFLQDASVLDLEFNAETQELYAVEPGTDRQLGTGMGRIKALELLLGDKQRRPAGCPGIQGQDVQLTGQITSSGASITGIGTAFSTELVINDVIYSTSLNEYRIVKSIADPPFHDTVLTLHSAFSSDITTPENFYNQGILAQRVWHFDRGNSTTTNHAVNKSLNITGTGSIQHDGIPLFGYDIGGLPRYERYIDITILAPGSWNAVSKPSDYLYSLGFAYVSGSSSRIAQFVAGSLIGVETTDQSPVPVNTTIRFFYAASS